MPRWLKRHLQVTTIEDVGAGARVVRGRKVSPKERGEQLFASNCRDSRPRGGRGSPFPCLAGPPPRQHSGRGSAGNTPSTSTLIQAAEPDSPSFFLRLLGLDRLRNRDTLGGDFYSPMSSGRRERAQKQRLNTSQFLTSWLKSWSIHDSSSIPLQPSSQALVTEAEQDPMGLPVPILSGPLPCLQEKGFIQPP